MNKIFLILTLVLISTVGLSREIDIRPGDIIGMSEIINDPSTAYIEAATQSRYGHVGVALEKNNQLWIYEEYPPFAQIVSIDEFLKRAPGHFTIIRRENTFTKIELDQLQLAANDVVESKYPYNYSQVKNAQSMNCSEFVNFVFAKAGVSVGKFETLKEMSLNSFHGHPWRLWKLGARNLKKSAQVLTPKSIMRTAGWSVVAGNLNPFRDYSDHDLYIDWKKEKASKLVADQWYIYEWELNLLSK
jgi:hypothetical protein